MPQELAGLTARTPSTFPMSAAPSAQVKHPTLLYLENKLFLYVLLHTYFVQAEMCILFFRAEDGPHDGATAEPSVPAPTSLPVPSPIEPIVVFNPATVHCEHGGQIYEDGATWNPNGDVCTSCICEQGLNLCIAKSCWVDCKNPVFLSDVCCPVCPGTAVTYGSHTSAKYSIH